MRADPPPTVLGRTRRGDRLQTWVLVASAFVLGLVLGAVAFVGAWRVSASHGDRADAARRLSEHRLHVAQGRSATLAKQLHRTRARLSTAVRRERQLKAGLRSAEGRAAGAGSEAARDQATLAALRHDAAKVTSDVAALQAYVSATPNQSLDGGFLRSQLAYLAAAARRLRSR